jgi:ferric-dicitrate binding protein FerR (iron transport regulator)
VDCEQALALLSAHLDREVQPDDRAALEGHLAGCPSCRAAAEALRLQDADLRRAFALRREAAAAVAERVVARLRAAPARRWRWLPLLLAAAAGFLLAAAVFRPWRQQPDETHTNPGPLPPVAREMVQLALATGMVEVLPPGQSAWQDVPGGGKVEVGARIRTPSAVRCELRTADGSEVRLNGDTEVDLQAARHLALAHGQILASVVAGPVPFQVQVPEATVTAVGTQFDLRCQPAETTLTVLQGATRVQGQGPEATIRTGEVARIVNGRVAETRQGDDLIAATEWVHELLVLKGRDNEELAKRVNDILARIGHEKATFFSEEEIRRLGDHCVLPLKRYVCSEQSRAPGEQGRRVSAARILADLADTGSIPDLIGLLGDPDGDVRFYAAKGLARLTGETQGRQPQDWRDNPQKDLQESVEGWQAWWQKNKHSYPGAK